ncbi:cingulin-like [Acropora millepora]|uniref:cingulin-like n=1 Tax=Acropora millepora TaxID=45264 RepID=UPI001CF3F74C|nr:cingulin-like [Acropora millepora]
MDGRTRSADQSTYITNMVLDLGVDPQAYTVMIKKHTTEIEQLKREINEKNEAILRLEKDIKELREHNEELNVTVKLKDNVIKALKDKINTLESEKKNLQRKLRAVEVELEAVKEEVDHLKTANKATEDKNADLEEKVEKLSTKMEGMKKSLAETKDENALLKTKVQKLEDARQHISSTGVPSEVLAALPNPTETSLLYLGEMCWRIQVMMYKAVHPNLYEERTSYKVDHIEEDMRDYEDKHQEEEAKTRWEALKKDLKWKGKKHTRAIKFIQKSRNVTAHPDLTEDLLIYAAKMLEGERKFECQPSCVNELIEMWKTLHHDGPIAKKIIQRK